MNNFNITNSLINAGADINIQDTNGLTPLDSGTNVLFRFCCK